MATPLIIVGAGGFGREVLCLVRDIECASPGTWDFKGFVAADVPDPEVLSRINASYLGSDSDQELIDSLAGCSFVAAIGDGPQRRREFDALVSAGLVPATLIHPTVVVGGDVQLGAGAVVCAGSILTTNIRFGRGSQVNLSCTIGHDVTAGDFVTLAPNVSVSGAVALESEVYVGTGAVTIQGVSIGRGSTIGAGAVVARDVPAGVTAVGVPAKPLTSR